MQRARRPRWLLALLPLLALRAAVPEGYMLSTGERGLAVSMCPATFGRILESPAPPTDAHALHAHHEHALPATQGEGEPAAGHGGDHDRAPPCSFALTGSLGFALAAQMPAPAWLADTHQTPAFPRFSLPPLAPVVERIRGPPPRLIA